jgi:hypothetical protein
MIVGSASRVLASSGSSIAQASRYARGAGGPGVRRRCHRELLSRKRRVRQTALLYLRLLLPRRGEVLRLSSLNPRMSDPGSTWAGLVIQQHVSLPA